MPETTDSPYRPPGAAIEAPPATPIHYEATGTFSIGRCVSDAWSSLLRNIGPCIGITVLGIIGFIVYVAVIGALAVVAQGSLPLFYAVIVLLYLGFGPIVLWGVVRFALNACDGRARMTDLFSIFERFGSRLGKTMAVVLALFLVSLPGSVPQFLLQAQGSTDFTLIGLAYVLNLGWSMLVSTRFFFSFYFLVDRDMGAAEALRSSWDWTRGNVLRIIGLFGVGFGIVVAGILVFLVGVIPAGLVTWLMMPVAFRQIAGSPGAATGARAA